jgi:DNA-binding NarL/FixJ family response regulator
MVIPVSDKLRVRIVVLDSNRMNTQLLVDGLARNRQFDVVPAQSAASLSEEDAEVALISANLDNRPLKGCEVARDLLLVRPNIKIIMLLEESTREAVLESFRSGARGIFCREDSFPMLCKCIGAVRNGQVWASSAEIEHLLKAIGEPVKIRLVDAKGKVLLASREQDVVRSVVEGLSNRDIAQRLQLSEHTVKNYLFRIFEKLGISNRVELILYVLSGMGLGAQAPGPQVCSGLEKPDLAAWCQQEIQQGSIAPLLMADKILAGEESERDPVAAMMWLTVAESLAGMAAMKSRMALTDLSRQMMPEQMAEARRRAAECLGSDKSDKKGRSDNPKTTTSNARSPKMQSVTVLRA